MTSFLAPAFRGGFFFCPFFFFFLFFYHCAWFIITITNRNFDPTLALSAFPSDSFFPDPLLSLQTAGFPPGPAGLLQEKINKNKLIKGRKRGELKSRPDELRFDGEGGAG